MKKFRQWYHPNISSSVGHTSRGTELYPTRYQFHWQIESTLGPQYASSTWSNEVWRGTDGVVTRARGFLIGYVAQCRAVYLSWFDKDGVPYDVDFLAWKTGCGTPAPDSAPTSTHGSIFQLSTLLVPVLKKIKK
jgi:hypothetical protein